MTSLMEIDALNKICTHGRDVLDLLIIEESLSARKPVSERVAPMLKQMRENTKTILWIVVVTFVVSIFAVWGMNWRSDRGGQPGRETDVIGTLDGKPIKRQLYSLTFQELYNNLRAQRGEDFRLGDTEGHMLRQQAWETTIQRMILDRETERLGITVTDDELVSFLRRNPHPTLRQMFSDEEGRFNYQEYLRALSDPSVDWTELERWGRSILPELKLETLLAAQVHVSDAEISERFERNNTAVRVRYVRIPFAEEDPNYTPSDEEIASLYERTRDEFRELEKRRVSLIKIDKTPSQLDVRDVRDRMHELRGEIIAGLDFAEAARMESDDFMSAGQGGDLGFFGRGEMDSLFTETAFALEPGEISAPIRTRFGYHLVRTEERRVNNDEQRVRASHILMRIEPGYDTRDSLSTLVHDLRDEIAGRNFERAAERFGLEIIEPAPFTPGSFIWETGYLPRVIDFAFNNRPGKIGGPLETDDAIYFVKVVEEIPERVKPLEEVRHVLAERVRRERREESALEKARRIREEALISGDLEAAAHDWRFDVQETPPFTVEGEVPEIGTGTGFAVAAHMLPPGHISAPVKGGFEWFLIQVIDVQPGDPARLADQRHEIQEELRQEKMGRFLALWYDQLRTVAVVKDLREPALN